jgi:hypothetical protein
MLPCRQTTGGSILLFFVLVFCLVLNSPILVNIYFRWSDQKADGLGLVNNANPALFSSLTKEQLEAAKEALSRDISESKDSEVYRQFNLDIAKLL